MPGYEKAMIKTRPQKRPQEGFTLLELMITIGILGILATISIYAWQGYRDNTNLRTAARDIATDIAATRGRAVSEGVQYRMTFNPSGNNYVIEQGTAAGSPFVTMQTKTPTTFGPGSGLSIQSANFSGTTRIIFLTRGTLSPGTVILNNSKGSQATITVNFAGRTHVRFTMQ